MIRSRADAQDGSAQREAADSLATGLDRERRSARRLFLEACKGLLLPEPGPSPGRIRKTYPAHKKTVLDIVAERQHFMSKPKREGCGRRNANSWWFR